MDQVVHTRIMSSKRKILGIVSQRIWRYTAIGAVWLVSLFIGAGKSSVQAQLLMSDNFDVGNTSGSAPVGWTLTQPSGTQISVVNSGTTAPASSPFCVRLIDGSASSRPQMFQNFHVEGAGRVYGSFKVNTKANGPSYLQLYTSSGTFLCALVLDSNGLVGYDNTGSGTVDTAVPWPAASWLKLEIEWFADGTFNGYIGTTQFVQRAALASASTPSRVLITAGDNSGTGRTGYVDDVQAVVTDELVSDNFDTGNVFGSNPAGWVVSEPSGTNIRLVDSSVRTPLSSPFCVEFSDNSTSGNPEIYTNFLPTATGRVFYSVLIPSTNQAPFYMHLRDTNGTFLTAISLGADGKMAYNANPAGGGPFTVTSVPWVTNAWQTVRVDWFSNNTFGVYLGSNQVAANVSFGTNLTPGRVLFRLADSASSNRLAYLDNVLVDYSIYPGTARHTNNATWLGYGYTSSSSFWTTVPQVAFQMKNNYRVSYWFLNVGSLDSTGKLIGTVSNVINFLNNLKTWENQNGYQFKVLAWLNADSSVVDVTDPIVRSNIVDQCQRLVSTSVPSSYVAGATRVFDGMQLDLEPAGQDTNRFNGLVTLFDQIRAGFTSIGVGNKLTSFTSPSYGTGTSVWQWSRDFYYTMGNHLDLLTAMTYDTAFTNGTTYQNWIQDQTTNILKAVSGRYWNNDIQHPAPTNGVDVMIGFPAFPNSVNHTNTAENISFAAPGVEAAVSNLAAHGDVSTNFFLGAAVYLHADGTGNDGYASYDKDWWMFGQYWLNTWNNFGAPPLAVVSPSSVDYGTVVVGQTNSLPFLVVNNGGSSLTGTAAVAGPFAVTTGSPYNVSPGQTQAVTVSFIPSAEGVFTNSVVFASNGGGSTNIVTGVGVTAPVANFSGNPTSGPEPLLVTFTDASTGTISNRFWDFGDGTTTNVTTNSVMHTYAAGSYAVTLAVAGPAGVSTNMQPDYIVALTTFQSWQIQYFGTTDDPNADPSADPDGDGLNNLAEFLAGTDPTDNASAFRIISAIRQGSDVRLNWMTAGGRTNAVQATTGTVNGGYATNFTDLSGMFIIPGAGNVTTNYIDVGAVTNTPAHYYRIRLVP